MRKILYITDFFHSNIFFRNKQLKLHCIDLKLYLAFFSRKLWRLLSWNFKKQYIENHYLGHMFIWSCFKMKSYCSMTTRMSFVLGIYQKVWQNFHAVAMGEIIKYKTIFKVGVDCEVFHWKSENFKTKHSMAFQV